jgi:hypothetical protein
VVEYFIPYPSGEVWRNHFATWEAGIDAVAKISDDVAAKVIVTYM